MTLRSARSGVKRCAHDRERRHDAVELGEPDVRRQRLAVEILLAREREVARPEVRRAAVGLDREQHRRPRVAQIDDGRRRRHAARRRLLVRVVEQRDRFGARGTGRSGARSPARRARDSRPDDDPRSCMRPSDRGAPRTRAARAGTSRSVSRTIADASRNCPVAGRPSYPGGGHTTSQPPSDRCTVSDFEMSPAALCTVRV